MKRKLLLSLLMLVFLVGANAQQVFAYGEDGPSENTTIGVNGSNENLNSAIIEGGNNVGTSTTGVEVKNETTNQSFIEVGGTQVSIDFGGNDGPDKFSGILPGAYYGPTPETPNIPLPPSGVWNFKTQEKILSGFPTVVTGEMLDEYVANKTFFVKDQSTKDKLAKDFSEAQEKLIENANVVIFRKFKPSNAIRLSLNFPGEGALEGRDYIKMGTMTFQTKEGLEKWYKDLKLENISSDDLMAMLLKCGLRIGSNLIIPTGQGAETMFGTDSGSMNLGGLLTTIMSLSGPHALPTGGSLGAGLGSTSGQNKTKAEPFLSVAFLAVRNPNIITTASTPAVEKKAVVVNKLKRDDYMTLVMCALPVPDPNGKTRMTVAKEELGAYLSSGKTSFKALINFQGHLAQARRDNVKGANLRLVNEILAASWYERAQLVNRAKDEGLMSESEYVKAYSNNLENARQEMSKHRIKSFVSLEEYFDRLQ